MSKTYIVNFITSSNGLTYIFPWEQNRTPTRVDILHKFKLDMGEKLHTEWKSKLDIKTLRSDVDDFGNEN